MRGSNTANEFSSWVRQIGRLSKARGGIQSRMASRFIVLTRNTSRNVRYRPNTWAPLTPQYAKKVGRSYATLRVSGRLMDSIRLGAANRRFCEVSTNAPYAWAHMFGFPKNKLPMRSYFPVEFAGEMYRPDYAADWELWLLARYLISAATGGALRSPRFFTRSTWEHHPIDAAIV